MQKEIIEAYTFLRTNNNSIPSNTIEFMKNSAIKELKRANSIGNIIIELTTPITLKSYLQNLMKMLWIEGEEFSGKRPFGDSGWQYDVYKALIVNHVIEGILDDDGYVEQIDTVKADKLIIELIDILF